MKRFATITVSEPGHQWRWLGLVPGAILLCNGEMLKIVGTCRGRQKLLVRRSR